MNAAMGWENYSRLKEQRNVIQLMYYVDLGGITEETYWIGLR